MQIITLTNHVVRKALNLSLREMAVLCEILQHSQHPKNNFYCSKKVADIASWLDISGYETHFLIHCLTEKGYIIRDYIGVKPSQFIIDLEMSQDIEITIGEFLNKTA